MSFKRIIQGTIDFVERNRKGGSPSLKETQTVLMINPFPNTDNLTEVNSKVERLSIIGSALNLLGALRQQPLVKPVNIYRANENDIDYSHFMMAPRRNLFGTNGVHIMQYDGSTAIACGALGGFSGFLDKKYREHDYELGRFNPNYALGIKGLKISGKKVVIF